MESVTPSSALVRAWEADWKARATYIPAERRSKLPAWDVLGVTDAGDEVGVTAVSSDDEDNSAWLADVWIVPERRREGHGSQAVRLAEEWARDTGVQKLRAATEPDDPAHAALFREFEVDSRHMVLPLSQEAPDIVTCENVQVGPMTDGEFRPLVEQAIVTYARHTVGREPSEAEVEDSRQKSNVILPNGMETKGNEFLTMRVRSQPVAYLWLFHDEGAHETFIYDVVVEESMRGRGYGRAIMRQAEVSAREHGMKGMRLHVHENNPIAVKLYESLRYRTERLFRRKLLSSR